MSFATHRNPVEQRAMARKLRALVRSERSVTDAVATHSVSRAHYYRLVSDLEKWEAASSREDEIAELKAQMHEYKHYDAIMWDLVSGNRLLDYIRGLDNILEEIYEPANLSTVQSDDLLA